MHKQDKIQILPFGKAIFKNLDEKNIKKIKNKKNILSNLEKDYWYISKLLNYTISQIYQPQEIKSKLKQHQQCLTFKFHTLLVLISVRIKQYSILTLLDYNKINQVKYFNRLSIPSLDDISIQSNPLIQINALTQSKITFKRLKCLILQYSLKQAEIHQDLNVIIKLLSESIENLKILSDQRIIQTKVQSMLKLRFPTLNIQN